MWKKAISLKWLSYHLITLARFIYLFQPFRIQGKFLPVRFTPGGSWNTFIFSSICCLLIFGPILIFILTITSSGIIEPGLFVITAFGLVFSIIYRAVQGKAATHLFFDGRDLFFSTYGFYESHTEVIDKQEISGTVKVKYNFKGTVNYKLCIQLEDKRLILLRITLFKKKASRLLHLYGEIFDVGQIENPRTNTPINDTNISFSSGK